MHIETRRVLSAELIADIYPSYVQAWDHVQPHVAARHVLSFDEFAEEMTHRHIAKILVLEGEDVLAMTTLATDISAVPWANADFYRLHFADEIARGAFFYVGYTVVHRAVRGTRAVYMMRQEADRILRQAEGVIGFDMSQFVMTRGIGRRLDHLFPSSLKIEQIDRQSYFVADYRTLYQAGVIAEPAPDEFHVVRVAEHPELLEQLGEVLSARWPAFMLAGHRGHDVIVQPLLRDLAQFQVALVDSHGSLRGAGLSLPLHWDGTIENLPAGWDDAIRRAAALIESGTTPNCATALSVTVAPELGGRGLGSPLISALKDAVRDAGATSMLAPVRPIGKASYPLTSIEDYLSWRTPDDRTFDHWLRAHLELGAEVLSIARDSMTFTGTVAEWEGWLKRSLPGSGPYVIPDGLDLLHVDRAADRAIYQEDGVWVRHAL